MAWTPNSTLVNSYKKNNLISENLINKSLKLLGHSIAALASSFAMEVRTTQSKLLWLVARLELSSPKWLQAALQWSS